MPGRGSFSPAVNRQFDCSTQEDCLPVLHLSLHRQIRQSRFALGSQAAEAVGAPVFRSYSQRWCQSGNGHGVIAAQTIYLSDGAGQVNLDSRLFTTLIKSFLVPPAHWTKNSGGIIQTRPNDTAAISISTCSCGIVANRWRTECRTLIRFSISWLRIL